MDAQENEERYPTDEIEILTNIKENLKFLRKKSNLSQKDFAKPLLVTGKALSRYENDGKNDAKKVPPINVLLRVCNAYHVSIEDIITRRLSESDGILTTEHLLPPHEQEALNEALESALLGERVLSFEYGVLKLECDNDRVIEIPFKELQEMLDDASVGYRVDLEQNLRAAIDNKKYWSLDEDRSPKVRKIADILHVDLDEYTKKYELLWSPLLRYCKIPNPEIDPLKWHLIGDEEKAFKACTDILPFTSVQDLLILQYFTGNNPLAYIQDELVAIHNRVAKDELFSPEGLYKKAVIAIFGEAYAAKYPDLYEEMKASGRTIDCFQHARTRYEASFPIESIYLWTIAPRYARAFQKESPKELHDFLTETFLRHRGDRYEIYNALRKYHDSRLREKYEMDRTGLSAPRPKRMVHFDHNGKRTIITRN